MFTCSDEFMKPNMDNNPSPLRPNSRQGQANECSFRPEEMGGGGDGGCGLLSFSDENSLWKAELSESGKAGIKNEERKSRQ